MPAPSITFNVIPLVVPPPTPPPPSVSIPAGAFTPASLDDVGTFTPASGAFASAGILASGTTFQGIVHFAGLPVSEGIRSDHKLLTDATLTFSSLALAFTGTLFVDVCTTGEAALSATSVAHMGWVPVTSVVCSAVTSVSVPLQVLGRGFGQELRIPDALQAAWGRRLQGTSSDPHATVSARDTHSLTFRLRTSSGNFGPNGDLTATIGLNVTETDGDYATAGSQYVLDPDEGLVRGVIFDTKTGEPVPADEAVRDGYTGGLVHRDNYDPPDPTRRRGRRQWEF